MYVVFLIQKTNKIKMKHWLVHDLKKKKKNTEGAFVHLYLF